LENPKQLLINCDDMGYHPAINSAIADVLSGGVVKSVSLMSTGTYFEEAVDTLRNLGISHLGVHLVLAAEYENLPMRPIADPEKIRSLVTAEGYFHRSMEQIRESARLEEIEHEVIQQLDRAINAGFTLTHVDGHMFWYESNQGGKSTHNLITKICDRYGLPVRSAYPHQSRLIKKVHMFWDNFSGIEERKQEYNSFLQQLNSNLSELIIHPGKNPEMLGRFSATGDRRIADYEFFSSPSLKSVLDRNNIEVITWPDMC
jgi:predicted glycoside hydrolase/deacetylase ChbG (UPF0249 family)